MSEIVNKKATFNFLLILSIFDISYSIIYKTRNIRCIIAILASIAVIYIFNEYMILEKPLIIINKMFIYIFLICYLVLITFIILVYRYKNLSTMKIVIIQCLLLSSVFICYVFKMKLSFFNWHINLKSLIITLIIFILYYIIGNTNNLFTLKLTSLLDFGWAFIYPSLYEEIIFRGYLISGLKYFKLEEYKVNIVQAIIFGLTHLSLYIQNDKLSLIGVSHQILYGYLIGLIYMYFRSITPCVIIHALIDVIRI